MAAYSDQDLRHRRAFKTKCSTGPILDDAALKFDTVVSGAGKEEAGKPMGYQELPLIEHALRSGSQLD